MAANSESWEYTTLSKNSAKLSEAIAQLGAVRRLADALTAAKVIGNAIKDRAYIAGPEVTEQMRARPIVDGIVAKVKLNKARYAEFRDILLKVLAGDIETVAPLIPGGRDEPDSPGDEINLQHPHVAQPFMLVVTVQMKTYIVVQWRQGKGDTPTKYMVQWKTSDDPNYNNIDIQAIRPGVTDEGIAETKHQASIENLDPNTPYDIKVCAEDENGKSIETKNVRTSKSFKQWREAHPAKFGGLVVGIITLIVLFLSLIVVALSVGLSLGLDG